MHAPRLPRSLHRLGWLRWLRGRARGAPPARGDGAGRGSSAARIELVGHLAAGMAHDLNNLLGVVLGACDAAEEAAPPEPLRQCLADARRAAEDGVQLTRYVLAFVRGDPGPRRRVEVASLVRASGRVLGRLVGDGVRLVLDVPDAARPVLGRPEHVQQILLNLAANARDAMPAGGTLTVEVRDVSPSDPILLRRAGPGGPHVLLALTDTGTGMDGRVRREAFDPLFTTKPPGRGTGLGLSIVREIVAEAGGLIEVSTRAGSGTRFEIYLPAAEDGDARAPAPGGASP